MMSVHHFVNTIEDKHTHTMVQVGIESLTVSQRDLISLNGTIC